ncbi:MAG: hypothetical protein GF331_02925, partial [Chitinivibrionales bacterium]|nr:hypothetical protein [Chitinivibrionales bacterium]
SVLSELTVFGQDVFRRRSGEQAAAAARFAVPASYPVGPGDDVVIMMWGRLNEEHRQTVDRNGSLNVPHIGPVTVAGLPFSVMQRTIVERLEAIEGVKASVTLGQLRSIQVYVMGEVNSPGMHTMSALANVTTALFAAGGATPMGSLRNIELRRYGKLVKRIDFYDFLLEGVEKGRYRLQPGDVIFVPVVKRMVAVAGNVRRSAIYEISAGNKLPDVLELAGGVSPGAWVNRIQIERMSKNTYQTVLDVNAPSVDSIPAFEIYDGDIIKVFPVVNLNENVVFLEGNVKRPGKYALSDGMRISDIVTDYDMLLPETYFVYAVVERFDPPSYLARIIPFNLQNVLESPGSGGDIALQSRDRILVYHRDYFEPDRSVSIDGAVTTPGKYKLLNNMHIRDLILQAGGLREDASMFRGELYRRSLDVDSVATTKIDFSVIGAMGDDPEHNILLHRFDRVYVRQKRGWQEQNTVTLSGEFVYPGTYVAFEGETLSELIERAGGFTEDAYLAAAIMVRPSVKQLEKKRLQEYVQQLERDIVQTSAMVAAEEAAGELETMLNQQLELLRKLRATEPVGRVVIDLANPKSYAAFLLENGDMLHVPKTQQTVSVIGEVYNPATFRYLNDRKQVRHYVELSGGLKPTGRKRDVYVIRANGSVVSRQMTRVMRYRLMPGDVVVVPQRVSYGSRFRRFSNTLDTILKLTTISQQASSTILGLKLATE